MTSYPTEVAVFAECELCEGVGDVILNLNARAVLTDCRKSVDARIRVSIVYKPLTSDFRGILANIEYHATAI